jgi:hypothetical protein
MSIWDRTRPSPQRSRLWKIFSKASHLAPPRDEEEFEGEEEFEEEPEDNEEDDEAAALPPQLEQAIAAVIAANPALTKQDAVHWLIHTPHGRALVAHLSKRKDSTPMTAPTYQSILKDFGGLESICKRITTINDASGVSEHQLYELAEVEAQKTRKSNETPAQAFSRFYQSEEAAPLRKAIQIAKGMDYGTAQTQGF